MFSFVKNIALISVVLLQLVLLHSGGDFSPAGDIAASTRESEVTSTLLPDVYQQFEFESSSNENQQNPFLSGKAQSRLLEVSCFRLANLSFARIEKITGISSSTVIRCYADRHSFSDSELNKGHLYQYQQFRI